MPKRRSPENLTEADDNDTKSDDRSVCKFRKDEQRSAANTRERTRMRVLSKAFCKLKTTLPWVPMDTKLSKLDTLRLASSYIGHLNRMLLSEEGDGNCGPITFCPESLDIQGVRMSSHNQSVAEIHHTLDNVAEIHHTLDNVAEIHPTLDNDFTMKLKCIKNSDQRYGFDIFETA